MKTSLKVVGGKNDGREIAIKVSKFIIGRGEKAHLRPSSDLVSRHHCAIRVRDGKVTIEDLKSRNGTYVNGEKLEGVHIAKAGDKLRVGRLQLEMIIDHAAAGARKPKVKDVAEAAARTASTKAPKNQSLDESITDWLSDDDDDSPSIGNERGYRSSETAQLSMDDTTQIKSPLKEEPKAEGDETIAMDSAEVEALNEGEESKSKERYGKLPTREAEKHESSTHAADDVLRKFFSRR
jgi:predicted component of type VI protein secretion system